MKKPYIVEDLKSQTGEVLNAKIILPVGNGYVSIESVTFTENNVYTPEEGKAYGQVTVAVPLYDGGVA